MKGDKQVIQHLNKILFNELIAINQYFLHSRMFANWGYKKLAEHEYKESVDEMKHADRLVERILSFRMFPDVAGKMNLSVSDAGGGLLSTGARSKPSRYFSRPPLAPENASTCAKVAEPKMIRNAITVTRSAPSTDFLNASQVMLP